VIWSEGDPGSTILRSAEQHRADLIALGASGRSGLMRLALGSVAEHVVRHAPCSVWVVRRPF
jgi:nucleotide-binding universal stress UspA family protein